MYFIRQLLRRAYNFFYWGLKQNNSVDYDATQLYRDINLRLTKMKAFLEKEDIVMWITQHKSRCYRALQIAITLSDRLYRNSDSMSYIFNKPTHYYLGEYVLGSFTFKKCTKSGLSYLNSDHVSKSIKRNNKRIVDFYDKKRQDDKKMLFSILEKWGDHWWS